MPANQRNALSKSTNSESVALRRYFNRENSLFYLSIWCRGDIEKLSDFIQHILFKFVPGEKVSIWLNPKEYESFHHAVGKEAENIGRAKKIVHEYLQRTEELVSYIDGDKSVRSLDGLKEFYKRSLDWWPFITRIFEIPETNAPKKARDIALEARKKTEKYSDSIDDVFMRFFVKQFPILAKYASVIHPNEVFALKNQNGDQGKKMIPDLKKRLRTPFYYYNDQIYFEDEFRALKIVLEEERANLTADTIKGRVAYQGIIRGKVRIVKIRKDLEKIKDGEILVTLMTSPDYVPYLYKTGAIVTDEGGITCHAAIVAREMKKPCIIGTKIATKVLKDGDRVEVDAEQGIVRVLKKF